MRATAVPVWMLFVALATTPARTEALEAASPPPRTLRVAGRGEASAAPDRAVVSCAAVAEGKDAAGAQRDAAARVTAALERVASLELPREDVRTQGIDLSPLFDHGEGGRPRVVGYRARQALEVIVDDLSKVGPLLDAIVEAGLNEVSSVRLELKDPGATRREALRRAVEAARAEATAIADALGLTLGDVLEASAVELGVPAPRYAEMRAMATDAARTVPIEPGLAQVSATVEVRWQLVPRAPQ